MVVGGAGKIMFAGFLIAVDISLENSLEQMCLQLSDAPLAVGRQPGMIQ